MLLKRNLERMQGVLVMKHDAWDVAKLLEELSTAWERMEQPMVLANERRKTKGDTWISDMRERLSRMRSEDLSKCEEGKGGNGDESGKEKGYARRKDGKLVPGYKEIRKGKNIWKASIKGSKKD